MYGFCFQDLVLRIPHRDTPGTKCKSERNCIPRLFSSCNCFRNFRKFPSS